MLQTFVFYATAGRKDAAPQIQQTMTKFEALRPWGLRPMEPEQMVLPFVWGAGMDTRPKKLSSHQPDLVLENYAYIQGVTV